MLIFFDFFEKISEFNVFFGYPKNESRLVVVLVVLLVVAFVVSVEFLVLVAVLAVVVVVLVVVLLVIEVMLGATSVSRLVPP